MPRCAKPYKSTQMDKIQSMVNCSKGHSAQPLAPLTAALKSLQERLLCRTVHSQHLSLFLRKMLKLYLYSPVSGFAFPLSRP